LKLSALPEIAALLAAHGQSFAEQTSSVSVQAIGDYYVYSRNRFNRWMRLLDQLDLVVAEQTLLTVVVNRQ